jgi:hypothetical protein
LTDVDKKLLKMQKKAQEVIIGAAVKNNYAIVKHLVGDGYKIFEQFDNVEDFFQNDADS